MATINKNKLRYLHSYLENISKGPLKNDKNYQPIITIGVVPNIYEQQESTE